MNFATSRLIVPISPKDKKQVEAKAAKLGRISTAEFVRRAALAYEPEDEAVEQELKALLHTFQEVHRETLAQLDRTDRALDRALAHFEALDKKPKVRDSK